MNPDIEAIFLDVGNTLRIVIEDPEFMAQAKKDLMTLVEAKESPEEFFATLEKNWKDYRKQSKESLVEASEKELWTKWLLPHYPSEKIVPLFPLVSLFLLLCLALPLLLRRLIPLYRLT